MSRLPEFTPPRSPAEAVDRLAAATGRRISVDLRALATLRITLGLIVLADLLWRAQSLRAFYTDEGVLPTSLRNDPLKEPYSIHAMWGSVEAQMVLFAIAGLFAIMLLLGYRTRFATAVSWILVFSLQMRNPFILNSGDTLLRMLLFWGMFVPMGERWSLDARRVDRDRAVVASLGTLGLLLQAVLVYAVNSIHKLRSEEWVYGNAVGTVMQLEQFTVYLGPYLAEFPTLLKGATLLWVVLLPASPLLLVLTGWRRAALASAFAGMHLGMAATMNLGIFPYVSVASMIAFYPPFVWDRLEGVATERGVTARFGRALDWLHARDPLAVVSARVEAARPSSMPTLVEVASVAVPLVFVPLVVLSGATTLGYADTPDPGQEALDTTDMNQHWGMFAPDPLSTTRYVVAFGNTTDGERVNPFPGATNSWDRPPNPAHTMRNERWRKYLTFLQDHTPTFYPDYFGNYLCAEWNRTHDSELADLSMYMVQQRVEPNGPVGEVDRDIIVEYDCTGDLIQA